jgi:dihydroorotate dehydrogenase
VQLYTGWIFEGPDLVPRILEGLLQQLDRHGFRHLREAVGSGVPWI